MYFFTKICIQTGNVTLSKTAVFQTLLYFGALFLTIISNESYIYRVNL